MSKIKQLPKVLFQKIVFTALIGTACLIIGTAYYIFSKDNMTLALSAIVFAFSIARSAGFYSISIKQKYETVEGTCIAVSSKPFRKHSTIKIMDADGIETSLRLSKQSKVKIGTGYRFYFKQGQRMSVGSLYFDTALSSDSFLGFEELGEQGTHREVVKSKEN